MSRAPFQVLVFPFRILHDGSFLYAVFKRQPSTGGYFQGIAGGGEDDESPLETAKREAFEEAAIAGDNPFFQLDSTATIPVTAVCGFKWGKDRLVIPEYSFGVRMGADDSHLRLSDEHTTYEWLDYDNAGKKVRWDSNRNALWELNHRISHRMLEPKED